MASVLFHGIKWTYNLATLYLPLALVGLGVASWLLALAIPGWGPAFPLYSGHTLLTLAALLFGIRLYATHYEPNRLRVHRITLRSRKIRTPLRLLHISDVEAPAVGPYERRAFRKMQRLKPDLVIDSGDIIQPMPPETIESILPPMAELMRALEVPLGKLHVSGDYDDPVSVMEAIARQTDFEVLTDRERVIAAGGNRLRVFGFSHAHTDGGEDAALLVEAWLARCAPGDFTILVGHHPDYIDSVRNLPIDLCLAGHTHGGQVRLPFYGPILTYSSVPRRLAMGYHKVGRTRLNVSAGVGSERSADVPPIRFLCPSEMTLFELLPE